MTYVVQFIFVYTRYFLHSVKRNVTKLRKTCFRHSQRKNLILNVIFGRKMKQIIMFDLRVVTYIPDAYTPVCVYNMRS